MKMVRQRLVHAGGAEAYDVGGAVVVDVGEFAGVLAVAAPAAGTGTELRQAEADRPERAAAGGERDIDALAAEADDIRHAVAVDVREFAGKLVLAAPAAGAGTELREREGHRAERSAAG